MNGGVKAFGDQPPYEVHVEDTLLMEPHTHLHPHQTQSGIGPSDRSGPLWKNEESNKDGYTYVAQSPNEKPEKYSKVYRRQRVSHYKAHQLEPVAEETQGLERVKNMAITPVIQNQSKTHNQLEAKGKLKSKIVCNNHLLEEAKQLWELGTHMGLEVDKGHSDFIQSFADMEARDRNEAMELGERKTHR